jgi:hypothetical protein
VPDSTRRSTSSSAATIESKKRVLDADDNESTARAQATEDAHQRTRAQECHYVASIDAARAQTRPIPLLPQTPPNLMSRTHNTASSSSSFHSIINNALEAYEKRTKKNLLSHPLAGQLQTCNSPGAILLVLQQQVREINQSQSGDEMLTKWLNPTVNVLYAFTEALGEGVCFVCFKTCFPLRSAHSCLFIL